ncbi:hypothetical protein [Crenothrix sp.]|uniref:hypothetical protein n=1 Tax=Crenothrix sp. TaxID=3100433 RepID=UPI00374C9439
MSLKVGIVKKAIKWTPNKLITWVANYKLKGIAEITDFSFDLDTRTAYAQVQLLGEAEPIEVRMDGFAIVSDGESYQFVMQQAKSNRPWLDNIFARIVDKAWKIPVIPQLQPHIALIAELFKPESLEQADIID